MAHFQATSLTASAAAAIIVFSTMTNQVSRARDVSQVTGVSITLHTIARTIVCLHTTQLFRALIARVRTGGTTMSRTQNVSSVLKILTATVVSGTSALTRSGPEIKSTKWSWPIVCVDRACTPTIQTSPIMFVLRVKIIHIVKATTGADIVPRTLFPT